jgi:hypothetical protein
LISDSSTQDGDDSQQIAETTEQADNEAQPAMDPLGDSTAVQEPNITEAGESQAEAEPDENTTNGDTSEPEAVLPPVATTELAESVGVEALSEQGPEPETAGSADPPEEQTPGMLNFFFYLLRAISPCLAPVSIVRCICRIGFGRTTSSAASQKSRLDFWTRLIGRLTQVLFVPAHHLGLPHCHVPDDGLGLPRMHVICRKSQRAFSAQR